MPSDALLMQPRDDQGVLLARSGVPWEQMGTQIRLDAPFRRESQIDIKTKTLAQLFPPF